MTKENSEEQLDKVCSILDRLTLDALTLMQENIRVKLDIEKKMCEGETHLAKSRYIMGQNKVSQLQLPTEDSSEFDALVTVNEVDDEILFNHKAMELTTNTKNGEITKDNPIKWFGYLVPQNLHQAQAKFKESLLWIVKAANLQTQLSETCLKIKQLEVFKKELIKTQETS